MYQRTSSIIILAILWGLPAIRLQAQELFRYPEGTHGKGELRYIQGIPVLTVAGTPREMGEQMGTLTRSATDELRVAFDEYLKAKRLDRLMPLVRPLAAQQAARLDARYREEMEAFSQASGIDRDLVLLGHLLQDMLNLRGCSDVMVEPSASASGQTLFGRNCDLPDVGGLYRYSLLVIYRPEGRLHFASLGFPGLALVSTGMNEAGLCLGANEVLHAADGSEPYNFAGTPTITATRRLIEECRTCDEAERLMRSTTACSTGLLAIADRRSGRVFEATPRQIQTRSAEKGFCAATNHFRSPQLATNLECWRFQRLSEWRDQGPLSVADVAQALHAVNQGPNTIHSVVFEPGSLVAHIAIGKGPSTAGKRVRIDLKPLLRPGDDGKDGP